MMCAIAKLRVITHDYHENQARGPGCSWSPLTAPGPSLRLAGGRRHGVQLREISDLIYRRESERSLRAVSSLPLPVTGQGHKCLGPTVRHVRECPTSIQLRAVGGLGLALGGEQRAAPASLHSSCSGPGGGGRTSGGSCGGRGATVDCLALSFSACESSEERMAYGRGGAEVEEEARCSARLSSAASEPASI